MSIIIKSSSNILVLRLIVKEYKLYEYLIYAHMRDSG